MTQDVKHSLLPWRIDEIRHPASPTNDVWIVDKNDGVVLLLDKDKAQFIVTACNSHYELVEALEDVVKRSAFAPAVGGMTVFHTFEQIKRLQAALAKVKP